MSKKLRKNIANSIELDQKLTDEMFALMINYITTSIAKREKIVLQNFGTIFVKKRKAYQTVNPFNGLQMTVSERYKIYFKTSKSLNIA